MYLNNKNIRFLLIESLKELRCSSMKRTVTDHDAPNLNPCQDECCTDNEALDINEFMELCHESIPPFKKSKTDHSDGAQGPTPDPGLVQNSDAKKRAHIDDDSRNVFIHSQQDVPDWCESFDVVRFSTAPSNPERGDLRIDEKGILKRWNGKVWRKYTYRSHGEVYYGNKGQLLQWDAHSKEGGRERKKCKVCYEEDGILKAASYKDAHGVSDRLCSVHAKRLGSHTVRNPCVECLKTHVYTSSGHRSPTGQNLCSKHAKELMCYQQRQLCVQCLQQSIETSGFWRNDANEPVCAKHAEEQGVKSKNRPCRICLEEGVHTQSNYKDNAGFMCLCAKHAQDEGTYAVRNQCVECAKQGRAVHSHFKGVDGEPLCADHARSAGTYSEPNPCIKCLDEGITTAASHPDLDGNSKRLCAEHAKEVGTLKIRTPCVKCLSVGKQVYAYFSDENGDLACAEHDPTWTPSKGSFSKIGCECMDRLQSLLGIHIQHRHYTTDALNTGSEHQIQNYKVDGFNAESKTVFEFLGNEWHGWPPGDYPPNKNASDLNHVGKCYGDMYEGTMARLLEIKEMGYLVKYIWGHEYHRTRRKKNPVPINDVIHVL